VRCPALFALTGHAGDEDRRRTRQAGFSDHLVKPTGPDELRQVLADLVAPAV
jgi:CheY-like chemotaxis protein